MAAIHVKRAFVIGHPIAHSRSPLIHGHWIKTYNLETTASYEPRLVASSELPKFLDEVREGRFVGGNVTLPHKEDVFALCDDHDPATSAIGAFNTLVAKPSGNRFRIWGTNTDAYGFVANLDHKAPDWDRTRGNAIVFGAGGAARAVVFALAQRAARNGTFVRVLNRTISRAFSLQHDLHGPVTAHGIEEFKDFAPEATLVVNTTTIGMHGSRFEDIDLTLLPKSAIVTDIVYVPLETPLLADARAAGLKTVDGLGMLLHQAVPGFEAWFGVRPQVTPELRHLIEATL